jgi:hypothetical protein
VPVFLKLLELDFLVQVVQYQVHSNSVLRFPVSQFVTVFYYYSLLSGANSGVGENVIRGPELHFLLGFDSAYFSYLPLTIVNR